MQLAKCRIYVNEGHDVPGVNITPAEVLVLRRIHLHNVKSDPVKHLVVTGEVKGRSNAAEKRRLLGKYFTRNKQGTPYVDLVFPGDSPQMPETFDGVWPMPVQDAPMAENETIVEKEVVTELTPA